LVLRDERWTERESPLADIVDGAVRRIATSIAIAGAAVALAVYARPGPPRYEVVATPTGFIRTDTRNGTVIGCEPGRCMTLLRRGQGLAPNPNRANKGPPAPAAIDAPQPKALPAPATAPATAPAQPADANPEPVPAKQ
jgi:hypothetical protein